MTEENMIESKIYAFDKYCRVALNNEAKHIFRSQARRNKRFISFSDLPHLESREFLYFDDYFKDNKEFEIKGHIISERTLNNILSTLSNEKILIIKMYFYEGKSDQYISQKLKIPRSTIQYKRISALKYMKHIIESDIYRYEKGKYKD